MPLSAPHGAKAAASRLGWTLQGGGNRCPQVAVGVERDMWYIYNIYIDRVNPELCLCFVVGLCGWLLRARCLFVKRARARGVWPWCA